MDASQFLVDSLSLTHTHTHTSTSPHPLFFSHSHAQLNERLQPFREKLAGSSWYQVVNAAYMERVDLSAHGFYATPDITGELSAGLG
jgi:xanthine dehydrogenase molybdopterin-binding subunit B